jgi:type II secretory pathway pseudopilin PulG
MNCPHCGAPVLSGNVFCHRCRKRIVPPGESPSPAPLPRTPVARPPAPAPRPASRPPAPASSYGSEPGAFGEAPASFKRPTIVTILAVLNILGAVLSLGMGAFMAFGMAALGGQRGQQAPTALFLVFGLVYAALGLVQLATGVGLLQLKPYGRMLQMIGAFIGLLGIPVGTILSILILIYLFKPGVKLLFSGRAPGEMAPEERALVDRDAHTGTGVVIAVVLVLLVLFVACIGIIAAIAIPSLLRARVSANEYAAIGNLRTMISAQAAYQNANRGFYDSPECLANPQGCIPNYPATAPSFLDPTFPASGTRQGYVYAFHPGPVPEEFSRAVSSPTSIASYAFTAVPMQRNQTGVRSFCGDDTGMICAYADGPRPAAEVGACPSDCAPLQ